MPRGHTIASSMYRKCGARSRKLRHPKEWEAAEHLTDETAMSMAGTEKAVRCDFAAEVFPSIPISISSEHYYPRCRI